MSQIPVDARIYVAGYRGMVGSAIWRRLERHGNPHLLGHPSSEVDLRDRDATWDAVTAAQPDILVLAAARVGGILANTERPVDFLNDNLRIQTNLFEAAHGRGIDRLLFVGSSCIYPREAPQPMSEDLLLTGPLEPTNEGYALAKICGIRAVEYYRRQFGRRWISAMPSNLYGPNDNFDPLSSHVVPALIRRFDEALRARASAVTLWGTGNPRRELMHVDDAADACVHLLANYDQPQHINVGTGQDVTIRELASTVAGIVGYEGEVLWDTTKPDGMPRKLLDVSRLRELGWASAIPLDQGLDDAYAWFLAHHGDG